MTAQRTYFFFDKTSFRLYAEVNTFLSTYMYYKRIYVKMRFSECVKMTKIPGIFEPSLFVSTSIRQEDYILMSVHHYGHTDNKINRSIRRSSNSRPECPTLSGSERYYTIASLLFCFAPPPIKSRCTILLEDYFTKRT